MKLLHTLDAGPFQHHATKRQPSMKSSTSPIINHFHSIRGWIVFPESLWPGRLLLLVAAAVLVAATFFLFGGFPAYNLVRMARLMTAETPAPQAMLAA